MSTTRESLRPVPMSTPVRKALIRLRPVGYRLALESVSVSTLVRLARYAYTLHRGEEFREWEVISVHAAPFSLVLSVICQSTMYPLPEQVGQGISLHDSFVSMNSLPLEQSISGHPIHSPAAAISRLAAATVAPRHVIGVEFGGLISVDGEHLMGRLRVMAVVLVLDEPG